MFVGQYDYTLDTKKRLVIPAKFRPALTEVFESEEGSLYVTMRGAEFQSFTGKYLMICTPKEWDKQLEELAEKAKHNQDGDFFFRKISSEADTCRIDTQWRILLPSRLIKSAELKRDIMIIGNGANIEVWDMGKWNELSLLLSNQMSQLEKNRYST